MAERAGFWNLIAKWYARSPVADEAAYQKKLGITQSYLQPDWELFEFGCGTGSTAIHHAPHVKHIRAVDISPKMLEIARGKAAGAGITNITFEEAGIASMATPDAACDAVLGMSILHLVDDPEAVIAKVHRMLRPGGLFFSSTTCLGDMSSVVRAVLPIGNFLRVLPHLEMFTARDLEGFFTRAGFVIEENWCPAPDKASFIVARRPGRNAPVRETQGHT